MSSGWIISSFGTPSTQSVIAVATNAGQSAVTWTPLEASIALDEDVGRGELGEAIAEHKAAVERRLRERLPERHPRERPRDTGEHDRTGELRAKPGWAWLRPFRRIEDYELAMRELERMERERRRPPV